MVPAHKQQGGGGVAAALKRLLPSPAALGRRIASQASLLKVGSSSGKKPGSHRQVGRLASGWAMPAASSAQHLLTRTRYASCATWMWFCVHLSMLHCASHLPSACLLQVLFDISGSVQPGEVLALMGEPAAGRWKPQLQQRWGGLQALVPASRLPVTKWPAELESCQDRPWARALCCCFAQPSA